MQKLAMLGGEPAVPRALSRVSWPIVTEQDRAAVDRVFESGRFTSNSMGEQEIKGLEAEWAAHTGVRHCVAVANGTSAIALALGALGIPPGSEVVVPALSFIGSAVGPLQQLLIPVFSDVDPSSFNLDPASVEAAITPRTRAIMPVHLHGLPADMAEIRAIADRHGLAVVEDAAQAHGGRYRGVRVGALGTINAFSLNATKNLPTCGEGGLITTDDGDLYERAVLLRQFGERIKDEEQRSYIHHVLAFNHKISAIQAAFTRSQLTRLDEYAVLRDANVRALLSRLAELPGIQVPTCPDDREHAWHILRFRFRPAQLGMEGVQPAALRTTLHRALRAEGVPLSQYQVTPLPGQEVFKSRDGFGSGVPWTLPGVQPPSYQPEDHPNTMAVIADSLTLQRRHVNPFTSELLGRYADGFEKVWGQMETIAKMARFRSDSARQGRQTARVPG